MSSRCSCSSFKSSLSSSLMDILSICLGCPKLGGDSEFCFSHGGAHHGFPPRSCGFSTVVQAEARPGPSGPGLCSMDTNRSGESAKSNKGKSPSRTSHWSAGFPTPPQLLPLSSSCPPLSLAPTLNAQFPNFPFPLYPSGHHGFLSTFTLMAESEELNSLLMKMKEEE